MRRASSQRLSHDGLSGPALCSAASNPQQGFPGLSRTHGGGGVVLTHTHTCSFQRAFLTEHTALMCFKRWTSSGLPFLPSRFNCHINLPLTCSVSLPVFFPFIQTKRNRTSPKQLFLKDRKDLSLPHTPGCCWLLHPPSPVTSPGVGVSGNG